MSLRPSQIEAFFAQHDAVVLVQVDVALGSTPREVGAYMLVAAEYAIGTIGGGQLEYIAMDAARVMLRKRADAETLDVPLGPEIGQCCGGRVHVTLERVGAEKQRELVSAAKAAWEAAPHIYIFGAGHVGRELALGLARLPFNTTLIDTRADVLGGLPQEITTKLAALPEAEVRAAKPGGAFVVLTHDHALDFLIMGEVLKRGDAAYAGLIGSQSKRAQFAHWFEREGGTEAHLTDLVCPIGAGGVGDKRPQIIAALVIAEIIGKIRENDSAERSKSAKLDMRMGVVHGA